MATNWPCDIGGADPMEFHPTTDLFAIIERANYHAGTDRKLVIAKACDCARDHETMEAGTEFDTDVLHCEWVRLARNRADVDDWAGCIDALKHMGGPPVSTPTAASTSPWPCDFAPAAGDPDEDLFATIESANNKAPVADAKLVIDKACACAKHAKSQAGTEWSTEQKHVDWCKLARTRAAATYWSICIDALEHIGGGGDEEEGEEDTDSDKEVIAILPEVVHSFLQWLRESGRFKLMRKAALGPRPLDPS